MIRAMLRLDGGGAAWGLMRVRQTILMPFYGPNLEKETALSKQCFSPKYCIFSNDIS